MQSLATVLSRKELSQNMLSQKITSDDYTNVKCVLPRSHSSIGLHAAYSINPGQDLDGTMCRRYFFDNSARNRFRWRMETHILLPII